MSLTKILLENVKNIRVDDISFGKEKWDLGKYFKVPVIIYGHEELTDKIDLTAQYIRVIDIPHLHIGIDPSLRGMGLTTKIYTTYIKDKGAIFSSSARRASAGGNKLWERLRKASSIDVVEVGSTTIAFSKSYPHKQETIDAFTQ